MIEITKVKSENCFNTYTIRGGLYCKRCHRRIGYTDDRQKIFSFMSVRAVKFSPVRTNTVDGRENTFMKVTECREYRSYDLSSNPSRSLERFRTVPTVSVSHRENFLSLFQSPYDSDGYLREVSLNGTGPVSPTYNPTTPEYSPSSPFYSPPPPGYVFSDSETDDIIDLSEFLLC